MSATDKQRYFLSLWYLNYQWGSSNLLDVRIKSTLAFKIWKLTSLEDFKLPNISVLVTVASVWNKVLLSILFIKGRYSSVRDWEKGWVILQFFWENYTLEHLLILTE